MDNYYLSPLEKLERAAQQADFHKAKNKEWKEKFGHFLGDLPPKFQTRNGLTLHLALLATSDDRALEYSDLWRDLEVIDYVIHPAAPDKTTGVTCECGKTHIANEVVVRNIHNGTRMRLGTSCAVKGGLHVPKDMKEEAKAELEKGAW